MPHKTYNTPKRKCVVKTRLTEDERRAFEDKCAALSMSQSEYIRQAVFYSRISPVIRVTAHSEEMLTAISSLVAQYGKIGSNLNQIARYLNEYGAPYRRYVRRGSTGIALFVTNRDKPYLRYVFDVADTGTRRSSPELKPWEVTAENRAYVMDAMERTFGVKADGLLEAQLEDIAQSLASEYWADNRKQFLDIVANSFLEEYDELNIEVAFKTAVANSVSYAMYSRLVENPDNYFEHEDFQKVFDFNSRQTVNALGTAVNAISSRMFGEIEKAIGEYEQSRTAERSEYDERNELQTGWGLPDSEHGTGEPERQSSGQVWQDAQSISGAEQSDAPERHDSDGEPVPASVGDRGHGEHQNGSADEAVSGAEPGTGQRDQSDGVGAAHEQPESTGRGSRDDGAYQQLTLNLFLSENEQISFIDQAESFKPSAFSFAQEEIDHFLLLGSNTDEARKIVALEYMKQKPMEEIAQTLKEVYHGGFGIKEDIFMALKLTLRP